MSSGDKTQIRPAPRGGTVDGEFRQDVLDGLSLTPKRLPCKYLYDKRGSELFDRICTLPEYYPTRTEMAIMLDNIGEIASAVGPRCELVEFGSGSSTKTRFLLDHLEDAVGYVPIDISREHLHEAAERLSPRYPTIEIMPVCADFHADITLPRPERPVRRRVVYFPGSTIGNFEKAEARRFLDRIARMVGPDGGLLIGLDLRKPESVLVPAYDDAQNVTAAFNLNLLERINREIGADFDVDLFRHLAEWNDADGRMELYLVSTIRQSVDVDGSRIDFAAGERVLTEHSNKYSLDGFARIAAAFEREGIWMDEQGWFCVQLLRPRAAAR